MELPVIAAGVVFVTLFGIIAGLFLMGIDRICAARMQMRQGPPLTQPFTDMRKLLCKDSVVPANAIPTLFHAAPIVAFASAVSVLVYLPLGSILPVGTPLPMVGEYGDLILIMYLLTVPALAMVAGGFASGSPYASIGAQREMVTMIAYEFPLAIAIIAIAWRLAVAGLVMPFSVNTLVAHPIWTVVGPLGIIGCILLLIVLAWVTPAELSRIPCDTPEAETELCGGLLVEYSGRNLALFSLSMAAKLVAMSGLSVLLFFPWNLSPVIGVSGVLGAGIDLLFFLVKVIIVMFFSVSLVRVVMARFRINTVVSLYWGWLTTIGLIGMVLIILDGSVLWGCLS
ncbi:complex I subunit 1 family protein [Methanospirillum sp.]|uniref:complex I subunit 1 family protein n=1 Tax=Methanospirillum sp. TaxID=45200 RepID=UPI002D1FA219|nr:complex I subunit 1 family protein [Methanospirillum sp.]